MGKKMIKSGKEPVDVSAGVADKSDIGDILQTFSTSASMHGLSKITEVRYTPFRIIWILATLTCSGCLIWQIYTQVELYNQHYKKTLLTVSYDPITFPDVTLCNHRHIDVDILYSLFSQYHLNQGGTDATSLYQMKNVSRARPALELEFFKLQSEYVKTVHYYMENFTNYTHLFNQPFSRTVFWSVLNLTHSGMNSLVAPVEELVTVCRWGDEKCASKIIEIEDNYFRKCVTLRPPMNKTIQEGIENGLSLLSMVGSGMLPFSDIIKNYTTTIPGLSEYGHPLAGAEGLRVVVHQRGTPPLPMSEGFTIPPGYMGSLGIKVNRYQRMKAPYGDCTETDPYSGDRHEKYRLAVCLQRCIQNHTIEECGCSNPTLTVDTRSHNIIVCNNFEPIPDDCQSAEPPLRCLAPFEDLANKSKCAKSIKTTILTRRDIMKYCGCYPACSEDAYNIGFSLGAWPSLMETDFIWNSELEPQIQYLNSSLNYSDTKKQLFSNHFTTSNRYKAMQDFVKLNVYLSDAAVQETTEEEDYLLINLVADIGGTMGLWVGMSLLSLMEVVQLLLDILTTVCNRNKKETK